MPKGYSTYQEQAAALREHFSGDRHFKFRNEDYLPYWWDGGRYWVQTNAGRLNTALLCDRESASAAKDLGDFIAAVEEAKRLSAEARK